MGNLWIYALKLLLIPTYYMKNEIKIIFIVSVIKIVIKYNVLSTLILHLIYHIHYTE